MKFLCGIESLQISARAENGRWRLDGTMPCVTNPRPQGFVVAAATTAPDGTAAIVAVTNEAQGLTRSPDLVLLGLQLSNTAAIALEGTSVQDHGLLHASASARAAREPVDDRFVKKAIETVGGLQRFWVPQPVHAPGNRRSMTARGDTDTRASRLGLGLVGLLGLLALWVSGHRRADPRRTVLPAVSRPPRPSPV